MLMKIPSNEMEKQIGPSSQNFKLKEWTFIQRCWTLEGNENGHYCHGVGNAPPPEVGLVGVPIATSVAMVVIFIVF